MIIGVGIILDLIFIKNEKDFKTIGLIGMLISAGGLSILLISTLVVFFLNMGETSVNLRMSFGLYFCIITVAVIVIERFWNSKIKPTNHEKSKIETEEIGEKAPKSKKFLKKGLKEVTKTVGKIAGDMAGDLVADKLAEITDSEVLAGIAGGITEKGVSTLTEKGLSKLAEKALSPSKSKGVSKLLDAGVDGISESKKIPSISRVSPEPIKVDYKKRLLGIILAKKQVKIEYISNILKLPRIEIIGMIYELIGKGKISGSFNENDTEFRLQ